MKNSKWIILLIFIPFLYSLESPQQFSAKFTEYIYQKNKKLTYKGLIIFKNQNIYWKYTHPNTKEIWIKDKVYVYEPDLMQVTVYKKPKLNLIKILKNAKKIDKNLYLAKMDKKDIYFIYNKTLKKLWYKDEIGSKIEMYFTKENNYSIPPLNFPEDVDYIYQN